MGIPLTWVVRVEDPGAGRAAREKGTQWELEFGDEGGPLCWEQRH